MSTGYLKKDKPPYPATIAGLLQVGKAEHSALTAPGMPPVSYQQLRDTVGDLAQQLAQFGVSRTDRVAIVIPNSLETIIAFLAATECAIAAPLNPKYKADEFAFYYEDTTAKVLITLPQVMPAAISAAPPHLTILHLTTLPDNSCKLEYAGGARHQPVNYQPPAPDDIAMILHTSGTTSRPKRVPLRHRNLYASANNIIGTYQLSATDITLCVMPLFHIHGLVGTLLATLGSGGTVVCPGGFDALKFWSWLEEFSPSWFSAVPTMHQMLLARAERHADLIARHPLRFIRSSSAPLPPVVLERLEATFHAPVLESYGMTETSHQMTSNPLPPARHLAGTVGVGFGVEVAIMDDSGSLIPDGETGEVVVRGASVIDGYENNPTANATAFVNGWFRTGDQGRIGADGYLSITGRIKELINRGGEKISPLEIDDILLRHPAVAEALAFAVPHPTLGEEVQAALVVTKLVSESELRAYCAEHLAEFKVPRKFHLLEELPRGATGKLQRLNMAKLLGIGGD